MDYQDILYAVRDRVLTITLNRPSKLNAFTIGMCRELLDAFDRADADDDVRVIVVTGAGRAFCAGADLSSGGDAFDHTNPAYQDAITEHRDGGGLVALRVFESKKPVIAAINGAAVGVGITMTLPMDIRLAADTARFGFVFSRRGITPEACSSWFLPRLVGIARAAEWMYTGRVFSADEALRGGLVTRAVSPEELLPTAYGIAREIADHTSAVSVTLARQMLWRMLGAEHPMEAHRIDSQCIFWMGGSADAYEGVAAFLEKRAPKFTLRPSSDLPDFYPWWPARPFK